MTVVGDHGDRFFVIASQDSEYRSSTCGFESNAIADAELQHGFVSVHLTYESQALDDAMIQVYEFSLGHTGANALLSNSTGGSNTATGAYALLSNSTGDLNTADGEGALENNTTGRSNTAVGEALYGNTTGDYNTAIGFDALQQHHRLRQHRCRGVRHG